MTRTQNGTTITYVHLSADVEGNYRAEEKTTFIPEKDTAKAVKTFRKCNPFDAIVTAESARKCFYMDDAFFFANATEIDIEEAEHLEQEVRE